MNTKSKVTIQKSLSSAEQNHCLFTTIYGDDVKMCDLTSNHQFIVHNIHAFDNFGDE